MSSDKYPALGRPVRIEFSARHVHLSQPDQDTLFGAGYQMQIVKELSQTGQYAYQEKVTVTGPKGKFEARILGPCRKQTQVELSFSDARVLGLEAMVRVSGDLSGTKGCTLTGPKGSVDIPAGVINDMRHLHVSDEEAAELGLKTGDEIDVSVPGDTPIIARHVVVRVHPSFRMNIHLDTDEANAASLSEQGAMGTIVGVHLKEGGNEHFYGDI